MKAKRSATERYIRLTHRMMQTNAWRSLDGNARAIYLELAMLYRGNNNGSIGFSAREAARSIQVSKATAARALTVLQDRGFLVATTKGRFDLNRHATEWRLTEFKCDLTGQPASREFENWATAAVIRTCGESAKRGTDG